MLKSGNAKKSAPLPEVAFQNPEQAIKILLQCTLFYLTDKDNALEFIEKARQKLSTSEQITRTQFSELMTTVWDILSTFLQSPKDEKSGAVFVKQILQLSKDPPVTKEFAVNLLENLQSERSMLELKFHDKTTTRVSISTIAYRFDISMLEDADSTSPMKPVLILDLTLTSGKRITFRVPFSLFHRLRFSTARLLKEIQFLQTRQIITR